MIVGWDEGQLAVKHEHDKCLLAFIMVVRNCFYVAHYVNSSTRSSGLAKHNANWCFNLVLKFQLCPMVGTWFLGVFLVRNQLVRASI